MRYLIVPEDVEIVNKRTGVRVTTSDKQPFVQKHSDFAIQTITSRPEFCKGGAPGLRRKQRMELKLMDCKPGEVVAIEEEDYKLAMEMLKLVEWAPEFVPFADQMLPHFDAWEAAEKQDDAWKRKQDMSSVA